MDAKGGLPNVSSEGQVLHWSGRLLCAEDLRRALNGHREVVLSPRTVVTPLAAGVAKFVAQGECKGSIVFCHDAGLLCCVANKLAGLRAVPVASAVQAARAGQFLGANLVATEVAGRTFFEIRQILRTICVPG